MIVLTLTEEQELLVKLRNRYPDFDEALAKVKEKHPDMIIGNFMHWLVDLSDELVSIKDKRIEEAKTNNNNES